MPSICQLAALPLNECYALDCQYSFMHQQCAFTGKIADSSRRIRMPQSSVRMPARTANKALSEMIPRLLQQAGSFRINQCLHFQENGQGMEWHRRKENLADTPTTADRAHS